MGAAALVGEAAAPDLSEREGINLLLCAAGRGGLYAGSNPSQEVAQGWEQVHASMGGDGHARVPREPFIQWCGSHAAAPPGHEEAWRRYCDTLFDVASKGMMLPKEKDDVGRHCFAYAAVLAPEFRAAGAAPADRLRLCAGGGAGGGAPPGVRADLDADWAAAAKTDAGRVAADAFVAHYSAKHAPKLVPGSAPHFTTFLQRICGLCDAMAPGDAAAGLDAHTFRYAGLLAGEFYFAAAAAAAAASAPDSSNSCGCDAPVADALGVAVDASPGTTPLVQAPAPAMPQ